MDYKTAAIKWLTNHRLRGKIIAQRAYDDRYVVVLDSGPKVNIPLSALDALDVPEPDVTAPIPEPAPRRRRRRRKAK
jgi:hypothetical protein